MHPSTTLFFDVDTQRDGMRCDGAVRAPGAEGILPAVTDGIAAFDSRAAITAMARRREGKADLITVAQLERTFPV